MRHDIETLQTAIQKWEKLYTLVIPYAVNEALKTDRDTIARATTAEECDDACKKLHEISSTVKTLSLSENTKSQLRFKIDDVLREGQKKKQALEDPIENLKKVWNWFQHVILRPTIGGSSC